MSSKQAAKADSTPSLPPMPDFTTAQTVAIGQFLVAVAVLFGFNLDDNAQKIIGAISAALAISLPASDAAIRRKRIEHFGEIHAARQAQAGDPAAKLAHAKLVLHEVSAEIDALNAKVGRDVGSGPSPS